MKTEEFFFLFFVTWVPYYSDFSPDIGPTQIGAPNWAPADIGLGWHVISARYKCQHGPISDRQHVLLGLAMLDKYPRVKNLFLEFNTALPSSASVERLFSAGPLVLTARRNRLADAIFETLLMLKVNLNP